MLGARFGSSTAEIILTTTEQTFGTNYTLTVNNVRDRSAAANLIAANSQTDFVATQFLGVTVGAALTNSSFAPVAGGFNVSSGGSGISGTSDQFTFGFQPYTNNFDVRVRVNALTFANAWTRAALMARDGLTTNAPFAAAFATPGPLGCYFGTRFIVGGTVSMSGSFPVNYPDTWLRLRRTGNVFDGFASLDGTTWHFLGSSTIAMANVVQVGFALAAGAATGDTSAQFRDFADASGIITTNAALPFEPLGPSSRRTALVISEIMYNPPATWPGGDDLEFVEIWNSGLITEDLTGHKLSGEISYPFPAGTKIAPGQFLVVAKNPAAAQSFYGVACLGPYSQRLNNGGGTLHLLNELGGRLLTIEYLNHAPWPVAPNGTGHSLVLNRPSYGENDPRAWAASDVMGGSPGRFESYGHEPARGVVINEFLAHTDAPQVDYIELYNPRPQPVNLSGAWLSDTAGTNKYQLPNGTIIPPRGLVSFTQSQLGFALAADGESIFLVNSNQTRVLDAVEFSGQENGVSMGRYPNGAPGFQRLATVTPGTANTAPRLSPVVINEIMYHPISENDDDEYVELHNRSGALVNLGGWRLQDGISFTFPSNTIIAAGGYVVVAANVTNLIAKYPQLNSANTFGNFSGRLANGGERIALAMPDDLISTNGAIVTTNIFHITVNEVTYSDGGRWGQWSDGGGSSLELIDPDADTWLAPSWADSDESAKATWTSIDVTDFMENGQTGIVNEGSTSQGTANRFELFLQGPGEALLDNVQFLSNGGANLLGNGDFASGTSGWVLGGVLRNSFSESGVGIGNSTALHLVSVGRGDTGPNKIYRTFSPTAATGGANTGTMRAQARWLKGNPYILLRMRGNWMEVSRRLNIPNNLGTPGLVNSRRVANAGPAITDVSHSPVLPAANQAVAVRARVSDPDGISLVQLKYRVDPNATITTVTMTNDNGVYSATIPGQNTGTMVAFTIAATDPLAASTQFPAAAPTRECHIRWGESVYGGSIGTYRLWLTAANISFWASRERNANDTIDATFVYGNQRAVYNVDTMYSGSPFHTPAYNGPTSAIACDYEVNFPPDERLLGSEPFVLTAYDVADGNFFFNDDSAQVDLTGNWIARKLGQQYNHRRHVRVLVNGIYRGTIYDDTQQPNSEMLDQYFPDDVSGQLRKIESWFEFANDGQNHGSVYATLTRINQSNGQIDPKRYRWNWRPRATSNPDDWAPFTNLVAAVNATAAPNYADLVRTWMDVPNFLGPVIAHHVCGSWDSYAYQRGKNMFAYKPDNAGWRLLMWDIEIALGAGGNSATDSIYNMFDQTLLNLINSVPEIHREYLRGFKLAADTALAPGAADQALDERYLAFQQHNIPLISPQFIKSYIASRRGYLLAVMPNVAFNVNNPAYQVVNGSNVLTLTGTGPITVDKILVNGISYPVTWTSVIAWRMSVPLGGGTNVLDITATDRDGNPLTNATGNVTANYTGNTVTPEGHVGFNEIMFNPTEPGGAFVELFNMHTNFTFDLSGWTLNGLGYTFPVGTTLAPRSYLVLAENPFVYSQLYGLTNVAFATYDGTLDPDGETLTLFRPGAGTNVIVVDRVRYDITTPWPAATDGVSLQLMDATQDNARVANWRAQPPVTNIVTSLPQWVYVTKTGTLLANASTFYLYLGAPGEIYLDDIKLVAGTVPESGVNRLANGDFETTLTGPWNLSANFSGSALNSAVKRSGNFSLRLVATAAGTGAGNSISQSLSPTLTSGSTYTLSFWYLQNSNGAPFIARLSNSSASAGVYTSFDPRQPAGTTNITESATPGRVNNVATNLPPFPPLWLNELQANNVTGPLDNFGQRDPWAELFNTGGTNISLTNYYLTDTYANLTKWPFPGSSVASNGFTLVWCDNQTAQSTAAAPHANFVLAPGSGSLALTRIINGATQVVDYLNYQNLPANWSYGDVPDAQPFYRQKMFFATPRATNSGASAPIEIYINEWLADNAATLADPADGQFEDWFELYNPGTNAVDVGGYYLTDDLSDPFKFQIPNNGHYLVPANGYLLVWADNESNQNATNRADLHVDFALSKSGEALGLFAADGTVIDSVTFGAQTTDVTEGRFPNGAANIFTMPTPTPRAANIVPNTPPTLATISNRVITVGLTLNLTAVGSDIDVPAQTLSYSLIGAPFGMNIGSGNGVLTWTPTVAPATNTISVVVTDNGTPNLSVTQNFTVVTAPVPAVAGSLTAGNEFRMQWPTFAGQKLRVEMKDDLNAPEWTPITGELIGTGATMTFTNVLDETPHRFFRLRMLP